MVVVLLCIEWLLKDRIMTSISELLRELVLIESRLGCYEILYRGMPLYRIFRFELRKKYLKKRENLMKLYSQKGYSSIDEYFHKKYRKQIIVHTIFNAFPIGVRLKIKKVLHK